MKIKNILPAMLSPAALIVALPGCKTGHFTGSVGRASGDYTFEIPDSGLKDDTGAELTQYVFEGYGEKSKMGGGVAIEMTNVDDDLFADKGFYPAESGLADIYGYGLTMIRTENDIFRMPIRYGLYYNTFNLEDPSGEIKWSTIGPRFSLEPTIPIDLSENVELNFFAEGNIGFGATMVDVDIGGVSDDETSTSYSLGFEIGTKVVVHDFFAGVSYIYRFTHVSETDIDESSTFQVAETEVDFSGVALKLGARF